MEENFGPEAWNGFVKVPAVNGFPVSLTFANGLGTGSPNLNGFFNFEGEIALKV